MNKERMTAGLLIGVMVFGVSFLSSGGQGGSAARAANPKDSREIESFELAVNSAAQRTFSGSFAMIWRPKGGYLPGYGYVVSFVINIDRGIRNTPFGVMKSGPDVTPEEKQRHISMLKDELLHVLFGAGNRFGSLQKGESVAIMAFFEDPNPLLPQGNENKTLVMSVLKADLDLLTTNPAQFNEFKLKVKTVEY